MQFFLQMLHITSLALSLFIEVPVSSQESEQSCICVLGVSIWPLSMIFLLDFGTVLTVWYFYAPATKSRGGILIYPLSVHSSVRSSVRIQIHGIFCRMIIHIMEVCMSTGFWWSDTIMEVCMSTGFWWSGGGIICVLQTHFIFFKSLLTKQLCP